MIGPVKEIIGALAQLVVFEIGNLNWIIAAPITNTPPLGFDPTI
jgi:hypothetical protein